MLRKRELIVGTPQALRNSVSPKRLPNGLFRAVERIEPTEVRRDRGSVAKMEIFRYEKLREPDVSFLGRFMAFCVGPWPHQLAENTSKSMI